MSDEPSKKRRRRRSLRVPVDEVPRPTQGADGEGAEAIFDGTETVEIPAFMEAEEARHTMPEEERTTQPGADLPRVLPDDPLGGPRIDSDPPTVAQELPEDDDDDEFDAPQTIVQASESAPPQEPESIEELASVEVELAESSDALRIPESIVPTLPDEEAGEQEADEDSDDPQLEFSEPGPHDEDDDDDDEEEFETDARAAPLKKPAVVPLVGVVVQRVVSVASTSASAPPPPPEEDDEDPTDTLPGAELSVDIETDLEDEPSVEVEDLDVELEDADDLEEAAESPAAATRDSTPELSDDDLVEADDKTSLPPPPPPGGAPKPPRPAAAAPPPPPEGSEAKASAAAKPAKAPAAPAASAAAAPATGRRKKVRRKWFEELFNDDYLRTVPIPHPKTILKNCDFIEQRFGLAPGSTILDVGCGLGLHAVELTRRGYLVVGLDLSLPMLSRAADEAQDHGFKINFLHADMREMNFDGAFDAVLCWGTTLGYFDDDANRGVIERLYRALKPRGLLLLDVVNRDYVIEGQPNLVWFEGDGCVVMEETKMNYITSRLEVKRTVILDNGRQRDSLYSIRLYSLHELGQLLHHQGFRVVEVSGWEAHPGVFFGAASPKLIILAERRPQGFGGGPSLPPETHGGSERPPPPDEAPEAVEVAPVAAAPADAAPSEAVDAAMAEVLEQSEGIEGAELSRETIIEEMDLEEDELVPES